MNSDRLAIFMCLFDLLKLVGISFPSELYGPMQHCSHLIHPTPLPFTNLNVLNKLRMKGLVGFRVFMLEGYRKNSKIWDTSNNCHNCPKNRKV